ncbi:uncharacterized protein LOC121237973 isoform X1 [Juglans microcarpa x Juglans regia]|uniref:uncharacterized protein LOC121237973 isoform X1 n=1 Tax=Juglans microcarpa x Juglans regia TaxID=2249226 RepID=UPI001B7DDC9A|nr:uncharacterized protein LOC121237973 isoform X1 [Juglans microcarpa x Juglans regia]XP_040990842.1 uncharacterized protein LOC121237973 isoform X1 [Juglans microcarpa x Juglans regia]
MWQTAVKPILRIYISYKGKSQTKEKRIKRASKEKVALQVSQSIRILLDKLIVEAITNLKEPRGSDRAAIALYVEMMEFHVARVPNVHWVHHCIGAAPSSANMSITVNMARVVNVGNGRLICELCLLFLGSFC